MADSPYLIHIHPDAPAKPALGVACNGCGVCCLLEPCPIGQLVSRRKTGQCVAVQWDADHSVYRCGMVTDPAAVMGKGWRWATPMIRRLALRWISAGSGCDADIEATPMGQADQA